MKPRCIAYRRLLAVALAILLAGCAKPDETEDAEVEIRYGLGLEVPSPLPPRGPFLEGGTVVTDLRAKLEQMVPAVLEGCGAPFTPEEIASAMDSDLLYASIYAVYNNCQRNLWPEAERMAKEAKRNGTEKQTHARYLSEARASIDRQARLIDTVSQGATVAEVEMVSKIQAQLIMKVVGLDTQQRAMDHYLNVSQDEFELANVFVGLMFGPDEATTQAILQTYPWTASSCRLPGAENLEARIYSKLEKALDLARQWERPGDAEFVNRPYGALLKGHVPMVAYASERDWWQVLLRVEMELDDIIAYYQTFEINILPTQDEARYLVALYWNQSRSLVIQDRLDSLAYQMEYTGLSWEENDLRARQALSLSKMEWTFAQVVCDDVPAGY